MNPAPSFILASMLSGYPGPDFGQHVSMLLEDPELGDRWDTIKPHLRDVLTDADKLDDLRSEYIDLFDRGKSLSPLYETEYGRQRAVVKGSELVDIAAFYRAFGFELGSDETVREMLDHVSVELEFYALLLMKQAALEQADDAEGAAVVRDARQKFLKDHLGRFVGAIERRPGVQSSMFYAAVYQCLRKLVEEECQNLGVEPIVASWIEGEPDAEVVACATGKACGPAVSQCTQ